MYSNKQTARLAGIFYLIVAICGGFSHLYVRMNVTVVQNDAAATANNILNNEWLFRIGFVSDLLMMMSYFLLGLTLYLLLKDTHKHIALLMVLFNLIGVPLMCLNMLNQFAPLLLLSGAEYLTVFSKEQLNALVLFFMNMHNYGYIIAQVSTGTWLLPLGHLVYRSGFIPKVFGILLMIASGGYLLDFLIQFLLPSYAPLWSEIVLAPAAIGELSFILWLLIKGISNKANKNNQVTKVKSHLSL